MYTYEFYVWEGTDSLKGPYSGENKIQKLKLSVNILREKFSERTLVWYGRHYNLKNVHLLTSMQNYSFFFQLSRFDGAV